MTWPLDVNPEISVTVPNDVELAAAVMLALLLGWLIYRRPALVAGISRRYLASVRHVRLYILAAAILPVAVRLAILPWCPVPEPTIHDEFGHLLVADTLAHGHLANPPHALWRHLETIYVLQQPTYASSYPIGQGFIMAVGQVLVGHPWAGVLLAVALMSAATSWMLFGCLPPAWAAGGGLLFAVQYGLMTTWVDSYWGGAFCAFGGSLLFGALCRLRSDPSKTTAVLIGIGWTIVWLIRPYESLLPLLAVWGAIAALVVRSVPGEESLKAVRKKWLGPILMVLAVQASAGIVTAVHNRAVTGSFTTLPYVLSQRVYGVPQRFIFQKIVEEPALRFPELDAVYSWQKEKAEIGLAGRSEHILYSLSWSYLADSWYLLPLGLCVVFLRKDPLVAVGAGMVMGTLVACALYPFFFPHYIAAYACVLAFLILRGLMMLSRWSFRNRVLGPVAVAFLLTGGVTARLEALVVHAHGSEARIPTFRMELSRELAKRGGQHVVFVRYGPKHSFHNEWVYNDANIDSSPVVWCRWMGEVEDSEVAEYYPGRRLWLIDAGQETATVAPYKPRRAGDSPGNSSASLKK